MKILLAIIIGVHGLIHLMGFAKGFELAEMKEFQLPINKTMGAVWASASLLFGMTTLLFIFNNNYWWIIGFFALLLSQFLIISFWQDAKFGSIINVAILLVVIVGFGQWNFENDFYRDVSNSLLRNNNLSTNLLTEKDLIGLPLPVQKYLRYVGVLNNPKVRNVKIRFDGEMRGRDENWFSFTSQQYNFFDKPERFFFMKAKVKGLPTDGYHSYKADKASMLIKLLSLFPVVNEKRPEMFLAETVTVFNDRCLFAPATLIDKRIKWQELDKLTVMASFTNKGITINATLHFNKEGQLILFTSDDRYEISERKQLRFSTPVSDYKEINGFNLPHYGEAIWHYPEGKFVYGKFNIKEVAYNVAY